MEEIDTLNILHATMLAMERAVEGLGEFDASFESTVIEYPTGSNSAAQAVVGGDGLVAAISAASILAKVARDDEMAALAEIYPGYGLEGA